MDALLTIQVRHHRSTLGDRGAYLVATAEMDAPVWVPKAAFATFGLLSTDEKGPLMHAEISSADAARYGLKTERDTATGDLFATPDTEREGR